MCVCVCVLYYHVSEVCTHYMSLQRRKISPEGDIVSESAGLYKLAQIDQ